MFSENLNRTAAKFDAQFTMLKDKQHKLSSAVALLETAPTNLSKAYDGELYLLNISIYFVRHYSYILALKDFS